MCNLTYKNSAKYLMNWVRSLINSQFKAKPYLESDNRVSVEISHQTTKLLLESFCNDGKEELADSITAVQDCFARAFRALRLVATAASGSQTLPEGNECINMDEYRPCSVKVLEICERLVAQVMDSLRNLLERSNTSCKYFLDNRTKKDLQKDSSGHNPEAFVIKNTAWKSEEESDHVILESQSASNIEPFEFILP